MGWNIALQVCADELLSPDGAGLVIIRQKGAGETASGPQSVSIFRADLANIQG